ncbi:hypothetical protein [Maribacter stanieri]|uniref:Uncharacterized protein n=1 Tax=Maribacter stanieri TaxID=440514 RepID=A0A1I6IEH2_9FLAO|nr:hypothetical protein [Maribacter stanieri]SFR65122.1 hypothetical protein SAMN04488010_1573 [Maribacter stanieri]
METITRIKLEGIIERKLNEGENGLADAMELSLIEYDNPEIMEPLLKVIYQTSDNVDEVLIGWANVLNDFDKVC